MEAGKAVCEMLDMAFRCDEELGEWVPCTEAREIHAPIEELPCVLTLPEGMTRRHWRQSGCSVRSHRAGRSVIWRFCGE